MYFLLGQVDSIVGKVFNLHVDAPNSDQEPHMVPQDHQKRSLI